MKIHKSILFKLILAMALVEFSFMIALEYSPLCTLLKRYDLSWMEAIIDTFILSLAVALLYTRLLIRPLLALGDVALAIGKGKFAARAAINSGDEIGHLAASINKMAESLEVFSRQAEDYARNLEDKVAEKTEELAASNEELCSTNEELETTIEELRVTGEEMQRANHILEASEKKYHSLFSSSFIGMIVMNAETGEILNANNFFLDLLNYSRGEIEGKKIWETGIPMELIPLVDPAGKGMPVGQIIHKDVPLKTSDGRDIVVELSYVAFKADGEVLIQCSFHNITGRKWMEEQVTKLNTQLQARAVELDAANRALKKVGELKDEFVGTVSHELRTPLSLIKEGMSVVLDELAGELNGEQKKLLGISLSNVDRLGHTINNILDISRMESGKMEFKRELVDLIAIVSEVVEGFRLVAQKKGLELKWNPSHEKEMSIFADKDEITQAFNNLISNAIKFTASGHIEVSMAQEGDRVTCVVSDYSGPQKLDGNRPLNYRGLRRVQNGNQEESHERI